jgi:probable phosphoglycerate mutase
MGSLFLVRHATTDASASGRNLGGTTDMPLSAAGHRLAAALARTLHAELAELPHDEVRLVTSPARRCRETIAPVAAMLGRDDADVVAEPGLIEIDYGTWDGLTPDECLARDPELRRAWPADPYATRCPGGESGADVAARAFPILDRITAWLAADRARCAVVVAHNHVNRVALARIMGWPMADYRRRVTQDPAGYSIVTYGDETPVVRRVNAPAAPEAAAG